MDPKLRAYVELSDGVVKLARSPLDAGRHVLETACSVSGATRAALYSVDGRHRRLHLVSATHPDREVPTLGFGEDVAGLVAAHGTEINVADAWTDERASVTTAAERKSGRGRTKGLLGIPIVDPERGRLSEVLTVANHAAGTPFEAVHIELLTKLAACAGAVAGTRELYSAAQRARDAASGLLKVTRALSAAVAADEVVATARRGLAELTEASAVNFFLVDAAAGTLHLVLPAGGAGLAEEPRARVAAADAASEVTCEAPLPLSAGVVGAAARSNRTIVTLDAGLHPCYDPSVDERNLPRLQGENGARAGARLSRVLSCICAPVRDDAGRVLGVVQVVNRGGRLEKRLDEYSGGVVGSAGGEEKEVVGSEGSDGELKSKTTRKDLLENGKPKKGGGGSKRMLVKHRTEPSMARSPTGESLLSPPSVSRYSSALASGLDDAIGATSVEELGEDVEGKFLMGVASKEEEEEEEEELGDGGVALNGISSGGVALNGISSGGVAPQSTGSTPQNSGSTPQNSGSTLQNSTGNEFATARLMEGGSRGLLDPDPWTGVEPFSSEDVAAVETVAAATGVCLHKSLLFSAAWRAQRKTEALLHVVRASARGAGDFFRVCEDAVHTITDATAADRVSVFLVDVPRSELWCAMSQDLAGVRLSMQRGIAGYVARTGKAVRTDDVYEGRDVGGIFDPEVDRQTHYRTRSMICLPVCDARGRPMAVVQVLNKRRDRPPARVKSELSPSSSSSRRDQARLPAELYEEVSLRTGRGTRRSLTYVVQQEQREDTSSHTTSSGSDELEPSGTGGLSVGVGGDGWAPFDRDDEELVEACCLEMSQTLQRTPVALVIYGHEPVRLPPNPRDVLASARLLAASSATTTTQNIPSSSNTNPAAAAAASTTQNTKKPYFSPPSSSSSLSPAAAGGFPSSAQTLPGRRSRALSTDASRRAGEDGGTPRRATTPPARRSTMAGPPSSSQHGTGLEGRVLSAVLTFYSTPDGPGVGTDGDRSNKVSSSSSTKRVTRRIHTDGSQVDVIEEEDDLFAHGPTNPTTTSSMSPSNPPLLSSPPLRRAKTTEIDDSAVHTPHATAAALSAAAAAAAAAAAHHQNQQRTTATSNTHGPRFRPRPSSSSVDDSANNKDSASSKDSRPVSKDKDRDSSVPTTSTKERESSHGRSRSAQPFPHFPHHHPPTTRLPDYTQGLSRPVKESRLPAPSSAVVAELALDHPPPPPMRCVAASYYGVRDLPASLLELASLAEAPGALGDEVPSLTAAEAAKVRRRLAWLPSRLSSHDHHHATTSSSSSSSGPAPTTKPSSDTTSSSSSSVIPNELTPADAAIDAGTVARELAPPSFKSSGTSSAASSAVAGAAVSSSAASSSGSVVSWPPHWPTGHPAHASTQRAIADVGDWDFDPWAVQPYEAGPIFLRMLERCGAAAFGGPRAWIPPSPEVMGASFSSAAAFASSSSSSAAVNAASSSSLAGGDVEGFAAEVGGGDMSSDPLVTSSTLDPRAPAPSTEMDQRALELPACAALAFCEAVRRRYRDAPFHSFRHGLHVAQCTANLVSMLGGAPSSTSGIRPVLSAVERLAVVTAALAHDLDHPALTNAFLTDGVASPLAIQFNDRSVLENHHAALCFQLLRDPRTDFWHPLSSTARARARRVALAAILATDMGRHFDIVRDVQAASEPLALRPEQPPSSSSSSSSNTSPSAHPPLAPPEDRQRFCEVVLHAADISGQTQTWKRAAIWSDRVVAEFHLQSAREGALGADLTVFMKGLADKKQQGKLQADFCAYVLSPLWNALADIYPVLRFAVDNLEENRRRHQTLADGQVDEDAFE